jgi:hypothetical protein
MRRKSRLTEADHKRILENAERTRQLAEKAQAELDRRKQRRSAKD